MKIQHSERDYTCGTIMTTLRTKIGLTQAELADHLGISRLAVGKWETGINYPKAEHLKKLIELSVKSQAFPKGSEVAEIHALWKVTHQKILLDEFWLSELLSQGSCAYPAVRQESAEETRTVEPVDGPMSEGQGQDMAHLSEGKETNPHRDGGFAPPSDPYPQEKPLSASPHQGHASFTTGALPTTPKLPTPESMAPTVGQGQDMAPKVGQGGGRKWPLFVLIALVALIIVGSAGALFFYPRGGTTVADHTYPTYLAGKGKLAFFDPLTQASGSKWTTFSDNERGPSCQFTRGAYHANGPSNGYFASCLAQEIFSNFALEVYSTIMQGDCSGITLRENATRAGYYFSVCQIGTYQVYKYVDGIGAHATLMYTSTSPAIHTGLDHTNKIAVVASGSTMTFYINEQQVDQEQDSSYTTGKLGLLAQAYYGNPTDVVYSDTSVWIL